MMLCETIRRWNMRFGISALLLAMIVPGAAMGTTVPFTEDFTANSANWFSDGAGLSPLSWVATGGPDGGSYASTTFNFENSVMSDTPALFRGQAAFGSSGGAFVGDWVAGGVTEFSAMVRQDSGVDLLFYNRFATPANFPGAVGFGASLVPSGQWTQITIPLPNPGLIFEIPISFDDLFSGIGNLQLGIEVPEALALVNEEVIFDIDKVSIVPEPATIALLITGAAVVLRRRRDRREVR